MLGEFLDVSDCSMNLYRESWEVLGTVLSHLKYLLYLKIV